VSRDPQDLEEFAAGGRVMHLVANLPQQLLA
jgi:hypothetical protein